MRPSTMIAAAVLVAAVFVPALFLDVGELERTVPPQDLVPPPNFRDEPLPPANAPANAPANQPANTPQETPQGNEPAGRLPEPPANQPDAN